MAPPTSQPTAAARRPNVAPALVGHGNVQTLTLGKTGTSPELDGSGSFIALDAGGAAP